ncbi:MAG: hypothetical protein AAB295_03465, partial [Chloroflexota bacterium]
MVTALTSEDRTRSVRNPDAFRPQPGRHGHGGGKQRARGGAGAARYGWTACINDGTSTSNCSSSCDIGNGVGCYALCIANQL